MVRLVYVVIASSDRDYIYEVWGDEDLAKESKAHAEANPNHTGITYRIEEWSVLS